MRNSLLLFPITEDKKQTQQQQQTTTTTTKQKNTKTTMVTHSAGSIFRISELYYSLTF